MTAVDFVALQELTDNVTEAADALEIAVATWHMEVTHPRPCSETCKVVAAEADVIRAAASRIWQHAEGLRAAGS